MVMAIMNLSSLTLMAIRWRLLFKSENRKRLSTPPISQGIRSQSFIYFSIFLFHLEHVLKHVLCGVDGFVEVEHVAYDDDYHEVRHERIAKDFAANQNRRPKGVGG